MNLGKVEKLKDRTEKINQSFKEQWDCHYKKEVKKHRDKKGMVQTVSTRQP